METQTETAERKTRTDADTEQTIRIKVVRDKLEHLKGLAVTAKDATTDYAEALEAVAQSARVEKAVLRAFVAAAVSKKTAERKARAAQLSLLFDEVGA